MEQPIIYRTPGGLATNDDVHTRRAGEPLGHEPQLGEHIRFAMRHTRWDVNGNHVDEGTDAQGPWSDTVVVADIFIASNTGEFTYRLHTRGSSSDSWITLDWWICEPAPRDGALF